MLDLLKLGLNTDSTFNEIQIAINAAGVLTKDESKIKADEAAAGARRATEEKLKKDFKNYEKFSNEDIELFKKLKKQDTTNTLKSNEILKKFDEVDFNLIVAAEGLSEITDEKELKTKISEIATKYGKKMKNDIPPKIVIPEGDKKESTESGLLGIFDN